MSEVIEPRWMRVAALGLVLAMAAFGAVGLLLADLGLYKPLLVFPFGVVACIGLLAAARPLLDAEGEVSITTQVSGALAVGISVLTALWNGVNASQHVSINRDGGTYLNAGKWIATHGTLNVDAYSSPFTRNGSITVTSTDIAQRGDHLEFPLSHMLSGLLAEAHNIGGDHLMFLTVPILSGLALLMFWLLANRLLQHSVAALAAMVALALVMPQVSFSRDSTSEIPTQVLLFAALWLMCDGRTLRRWDTAFCAGLFLGLLQAMHIDGLAFLLGVPVVFAVLWLRTDRSDRAPLAHGMLGSSLGIVVGLLLATFDLVRFGRAYVSTIHNDFERLVAALVVVILGSIVAVLLSRRASLVESVRRGRNRAADVVGVLVLVFGFGTWFVRPLVQTVRAGPNEFVAYVQRLNHLGIDATRRYDELSVQWISWYLGPITLALGIVGAAALARALVRGSLREGPLVAALILAPPSLLYIWRPSITPDNVWAARRFLPAVFPGLILLTFAVLIFIARDSGRQYLAERRWVAVILGAATIVVPMYTLGGVSQMTEQRGLFPVIEATCKNIGPNAAVVMLPERRSVAYLSNPQTLRSFCNVPVAVARGRPDKKALIALAVQAKADGRRLFVVSQSPAAITQVFPRAQLLFTPVAENPNLLELTLERRPDRYISEVFQLTAAPVPVPKAR